MAGKVRISRLAAVAALALAAGIAACDAPTADSEAPAYDPIAPALGRSYRWPLGRVIGVYVDPTGAPVGTDLAAAAAQGAELWAQSVHYGEFTLRLVSSPASADVIVHHADAPLLVSTGTCAYPSIGAGGITFFCPAVAGDTAETLALLTGGPGRVKMDVSVDRARVSTEEVFGALVTHELGHVLGIGAHSDDVADLMFGAPRVAAPSPSDGRTLRYVLHQPPGYTL